MPTPSKGPRLGGSAAHERLMLRNLAAQLFEHDRITTTEHRAKRLRPVAERLITFAKRGDLPARRRVMADIADKSVVHKLFTEIGPDMAAREGGYTRIIKIAPRKGDNAPMAVIELVREPVNPKPKAKKKSAATAAPAAAPVEDAPAEAPADELATQVEADAVAADAVADEAAVTAETVAPDEVPVEMAAEAAAEAPVVEEAPAAPAADADEAPAAEARDAEGDKA